MGGVTQARESDFRNLLVRRHKDNFGSLPPYPIGRPLHFLAKETDHFLSRKQTERKRGEGEGGRSALLVCEVDAAKVIQEEKLLRCFRTATFVEGEDVFDPPSAAWIVVIEQTRECGVPRHPIHQGAEGEEL